MASRWAPSWESDAMQSKTLSEAEERMKKAIEFVRHELAGIRTGKASPQLLDTVKVEAYGTHVPLQQVGSVSAPEPRLLVIQPWDKSLIKAICRGVNEAQLGLNPTDDGSLVRIPIPTLTEERRKDLVKLISKFAEEGRVAGRQGRPAPGPPGGAPPQQGSGRAGRPAPRSRPTTPSARPPRSRR